VASAEDRVEIGWSDEIKLFFDLRHFNVIMHVSPGAQQGP